MAASTEVTRLLLTDNICHRLVTSGLSVAGLENDPSLHGVGTTADRGSVTDKARRSMRFLCNELYQKHQTQFEDMLQKLHIEPNTLQVDLERIMADVFYDQINWGRIATLVAFCSMLAEHCVRMEMPHLVPRIIDWTASFVDSQLHSWLIENNGWTGLVSFYDPDSSKSSVSWSSLKNFCGCAAAASVLGALSLALLTTQKV